MRKKPGQDKRKTNKIASIGITTDTLTSRGGLSLFGRYIDGTGIRPTFERLFGSMRKNGKGQPIDEIIKQVLCYSRFAGTVKPFHGWDKPASGTF